ncbi:biopolymer transport protein ExbD [Oryzisolibacter propanilivorax]|uniref:Biopolymer transport protein ExbD n=1 Tax=Oryzisolibacter propanilivorax TaxID=1527607 RepID=A0A1G9SWY4_9BURK|nr:biopolymer transporter ExbD [Oryzisolibacter propanilivorax]SDM39951.1 biopolymer transport protein ExbD [Oryzisolibacter propanilivorax]
MNFRPRLKEEPEINLIPFIDVLLVILIFLMLSTTYSKFTALQVTLPLADAEQLQEKPREIVVAVSPEGRYAVGQQTLEGRGVDLLARALQDAARAAGGDSVVIISADAAAPHQAVVSVMEAARRAGLAQITFATQTAGGAPAH